MYNIIPLVIILISLVVIIIVFLRHYSEFAELNISNFKRRSRKKELEEKVVVDELEKNVTGFFSNTKKSILSIVKNIGKFGISIHDNLHELKQKNKNLSSFESKDVDEPDSFYAQIKKKKAKKVEYAIREGESVAKEKSKKDKAKTKAKKISNSVTEQIEELFNEIDILVNDKDFGQAEKKLIEIIKLDYKNIDAFRALGEIYFEQKKYNEAVETMEHVIKLGGDEDDYFNLALFYKEINNLEKAIKSIQKAVEIAPKNIFYLELLFDLSIEDKNQKTAFEAYYKLKKADPSNVELDKLKLEIQAINK